MPPKGKTPPKSAKPAAKSAAKSTKPRRGAPPPIMVARPKPWGLIAATVAVVVFAGVVIGYSVMRIQAKSSEQPDGLASDAAKIPGISTVTYTSQQHQQGNIKYDQSPPFGGEHDPEWADCTGTVYSSPIRSENAVHTLEHGAVWITYRPGLSSAEVDALKRRVDGINYTLMSPYPGLKTKVSLQSWGHQLFVDSTDDPRIDRFIKDLRSNSVTTPENGASCEDPSFKSSPRPPDATASAPPSATASPSPSASTKP